MPSSSLFEVEAEVGVDVEVWVEVGDEVKGGVEVEVGVWGSGLGLLFWSGGWVVGDLESKSNLNSSCS